MRILITGDTGYLGSAIVRAARTRGHDVVVLSRHASRHDLGCAGIDGDVRHAADVARAAEGCEGICHTAALVAVWRPRRTDFDEINVGGLQNVLDVAGRSGITRLVYTSSFLALPPRGHTRPGDWNDYQRTKVEGDRLATRLVERGMPLIRLYPGVIYGPGPPTEGNLLGRMLADHLAGRLPGLIGADRIWSFAFVEEVARAHVTALERGVPGSSYALGGENVPQIRPFEIAREITGRPLPRRIPGSVARVVALGEEMLAAGGRTPRLTRGTVRVLEQDWPLDSGSAMRDLDYRPTALADGVREVLASLGSRVV
jgi:NAD+-dependent farnesol dehydrogenase